MQISFSCPSCGKDYDLPWSLAGKRARCKKCSSEFVIPAPIEARPPRSSEAIPIARVIEPPRSPGPPRSYEVEPTPPRPPANRRARDKDVDDPPWPHHAQGRPQPAPAQARPDSSPGRTTRPTKIAPGSLKPPPPWPRWLIPAVAGGGVALILAANLGLYFVLFRGEAPVEQVEENRADPVDLGRLAGGPAVKAPEGIAAPVAPSPSGPEPSTTAGPSRVAARAAEDIPDRPMNSAEIVARYESSVALIKGKKGSGTGFIARAGIVATNAHVIDGERIKDVEVRFPSAEEGKQGPYPARLLFQDKPRDLALLAVATDLPPVRVAEGYRFRKGEDVTVIGNPGLGGKMILENAISRGIVSSMTTINNQSFLQLGISINPGNSGGPVFDPKGRVIGVVTLKTTRQEGLAFAVPAEDLLSALGTAETVAGSGPAASRSGAPTLAYAWKKGETYVYSFELTIDAGASKVALAGNSIYRVKDVDADGITLSHKGWFVTTRRGKDGRVQPGGTSPPQTTQEIEVKIDPQGEVLSAKGSSPLPLLGDFSMLLIEPLPDDPQRSWDDSKTITLNEVEQVPGSGGGIPRLGRPGLDNLPRGSIRSRTAPRSRPGSRLGSRLPAAPPPSQPTVRVIAHEATEETTYTLGEVKGDAAPISKNYELSTREMVGKEPRLKMIGDGTISFDVKAGIPLAMNYRLDVVETSGNAQFRIPITVACKLLDGRDREKGLRPPTSTPLAMNRIEGGDLNRVIAELKSPDANRRREACRALFDAAPVESKRGEISRALERLATDKDMGVRGDVIKAMGVWGDRKIVDALIASLGDPNFGVRDELFEAIARLSPTEKSAEAVIRWLARDAGRAQKALRAIGPPAEGPLLRVVEEGTDPKVRQEACRLLKDVGTSQSIPALEKLARGKQDGEVGRVADEAIRNIARRWPTDDEWAALLKQARSPDGGRRRDAADRLMKIEPVDARRAEAARALESLVGDVDGGTQSLAFRALAAWGGANSRSAIIARLEDPDLRPVREAIEALGKLGPDEASARAIGGRIGKEKGVAIEALAAMGPVAEKAALGALKDVGNDGFLRNDLFKLLGKIGTRASLAALRAAAGGRDGGEARRALKDVEDRASGGAEWVSSLLLDLKSEDGNRRGQAVRKLASLPPIPNARAQVARSLDAVWDIDDLFIKKSLREAVVGWGDDRSADFLTDRLADPEFKQWEEALRSLAALRPAARTAELLAARFAQDAGLVVEIARKMPALAERPLLAIVTGGGEQRQRVDACRALGNLGTPASVPGLQALARRAGEDQLARDAEDALKAIAGRQ